MLNLKEINPQGALPTKKENLDFDMENLIIETMQGDLLKVKEKPEKRERLDTASPPQKENFLKKKDLIPPVQKEKEPIVAQEQNLPKGKSFFESFFSSSKGKSETEKEHKIDPREEQKKQVLASEKQKSSPFFGPPEEKRKKEIPKNPPEIKMEIESKKDEEITQKNQEIIREKAASTLVSNKIEEKALPEKRKSVLDELIASRLEENNGSLVIKETSRPKTAWGKLFARAFFIFFVLFLAAGIYYLWATKQLEDFSFEKITFNLENVSLEKWEYLFIKKDAPKEEPPLFSQNNPNYLNLNMSSLLKADVKAKIDEISTKMISLEVSHPVEFIISDQNNNPVPLSVFIQKMEISFSSELLSKLSEEFSLFVYIDNKKPRLGLVIDLSQKELIKETLLKEEANLPKELESLFLAINYKIENKAFQTGRYNEITTRYVNIPSPEVLSIDYGISNEQLVIGTSQATFRAMIDYLKSQDLYNQPSSANPSTGLPSEN